MRISGSGSYFVFAQEVVDELKIGRNEVKGINIVGKVVTVILASLYDDEVCNKD